MNKYEEAYKRMEFVINGFTRHTAMELHKDIPPLKELVEKATPKKPIEQRTWTYDEIPYTALCPNCKENLGYESKRLYKHYPTCGQALDWSEEDD